MIGELVGHILAHREGPSVELTVSASLSCTPLSTQVNFNLILRKVLGCVLPRFQYDVGLIDSVGVVPFVELVQLPLRFEVCTLLCSDR